MKSFSPRVVRLLQSSMILLIGGIPSVQAKRLDPQAVEPIIYQGFEYRAPHHRMGYVEAWDIKTGERSWEKKVYEVVIDPRLETDVQWVFITRLSIHDGKLRVVNEQGKQYELDPGSGNALAGRNPPERVEESRPTEGPDRPPRIRFVLPLLIFNLVIWTALILFLRIRSRRGK